VKADYIATMGRMISSPREFVLERTSGPPALLTLTVSLLVALAVSAAGEPLSWHSVVLDAAFKVGAIIIVAGVVWLSWRIVGGRTSGLKFIVAYSYLAAAWLLVFSLLIAIDEGAMRLIEPGLFAQINAVASSGQDSNRLKALVGSQGTYAMKVVLYSNQEFADTIRTPGLLWIVSMAAVRGAFTIAWLIVSWGAFRQILRTSWLQSVFSLGIFLGFCLIAALVILFFQMAPIDVDPNRWLQKWRLTA
jgi:hypothetical protein